MVGIELILCQLASGHVQMYVRLYVARKDQRIGKNLDSEDPLMQLVAQIEEIASTPEIPQSTCTSKRCLACTEFSVHFTSTW